MARIQTIKTFELRLINILGGYSRLFQSKIFWVCRFPLIDELGDIDTRRQCPDLHFGILCLERALSHGFSVEGEQGEYDFSDRLSESDVKKMAVNRNPHLFGGQGR